MNPSIPPQTVPLAWAGWSLRIPEAWRPLQVNGSGEKGTLAVGDSEAIVFQVKWSRTAAGFDAPEWLEGRILKATGGRTVPRTPLPRTGALSHSVWIPDGGDEKEKRGFWYGHSPQAGLALEVVVNRSLPESITHPVPELTLPSIRTSPAGSPTVWRVFGCRFESPPGYRIERQRLQLGDMAIAFRGPAGERLVVRQVYPSGVALERRSLERWLEDDPLPEKKRYRILAKTEPFEIDLPGGQHRGLLRTGWKKLPVPLGWLRPRRHVSAVLHDTGMERLQLAAIDARTGDGLEPVREVLASMGREEADP